MKPMKARESVSEAGGFTRLELVAVLAMTALLCLIALPLLAQSKPRSQFAVCFNNLRRVGQAFLLWSASHGEGNPWVVNAGPDGGTRNHPSGLYNNIWFQFSWLSNELRTPKILACPSDDLGVVATEFSGAPKTGFLNASLRNVAVSYFLGLDAASHSPQSVLSGDWNIKIEPATGGCATGINPVYSVVVTANGGWTNTYV